MKETVKVLMARDGLSKDEAVKKVVGFFNEMREDWKNGGDLSEWEHIFMDEFGLEPDFFEDFLFRLC